MDRPRFDPLAAFESPHHTIVEFFRDPEVSAAVFGNSHRHAVVVVPRRDRRLLDQLRLARDEDVHATDRHS
ncbi:hypothetical protein A3K89_05955 [Rhodococcoides kyotonense]|uniref:Uncharacterized protein n=1 Tax=Rhodococcoides kyotonense TaxID=398843 RepID=A0A177YH32_9NOCA|nr:hypothetical protein A3K89_05955 [Rhodococcus kyotonensis]